MTNDERDVQASDDAFEDASGTENGVLNDQATSDTSDDSVEASVMPADDAVNIDPLAHQEPAADLSDAAIAEESVAEYADGEGFVGTEAPATPLPAPTAVQYGVGPFSIREFSLMSVWLVGFVVSFFSVAVVGFNSVWTGGLSWILTIGLPTAAVFLIVLRRLSPEGIRRVGSLGIDQFASVAFSVSAMLWLQMVWDSVSFAAQRGIWLHTWVAWVELFLMLGGVVLTVFAPMIPVLRDDFRARPEVVAHPNARPVRAIAPRPRPVPVAAPAPTPQQQAVDSEGAAPAPVVSEPGAMHEHAQSGADEAHTEVVPTDGSSIESPEGEASVEDASGDSALEDSALEDSALEDSVSDDTVLEVGAPVEDSAVVVESASAPADEAESAESASSEPVVQAFWALVPEERPVVDAEGTPLFVIGPTAWALVIEDRGEVFVVRHEDGRLGFLHDVSGVTRG